MNGNALPAVTVIGPFPPPVHGAAAVTARMADALGQRGAVTVLDISPDSLRRGWAYHATRIGRVLRALGRLASDTVSGPAGAAYISAAGGSGLAYNAVLAAAARLLRRPLFVHHHSFAYADRRTRMMVLLVRVSGPDAIHICLCPGMARALEDHYGPGLRTEVVSNAAFYEPGEALSRTRPRSGLVLGHLSNLDRDKGLDLVLDVANGASGAVSRLVLAGPAGTAEAEAMLREAQARMGARLDWRGPVQGNAKAAFFREIDVFLFPSRYVHEAEPLVVLEALQAGVPVIAYGRGCIPGMIPEGAGLVIPPRTDYTGPAIRLLRQWSDDGGTWEDASARAADAARALHADGRADLARLLDRILDAGRSKEDTHA